MQITHHKYDGEISYFKLGTPSPFPKDLILFFHGFGQAKETLLPSTKLLYNKLIKTRSLTTTLEVIIPDLNRHGENVDNLLLIKLFKNFTSKILHLKNQYKSISLIGISLGSILNSYLASEYAEHVQSAVFISLPYNIRNSLPKKLRAAFMNEFFDTPRWPFPLPHFFNELKLLKNEFQHLRWRQTWKGPEIAIGKLNYISIPELLAYLQSDFRTLPYIKKVHCPSLFIYGGQDEYLGARRNQLDNELLSLYQQCPSPNKYLYLIKNASHGLSDINDSNLNFLNSERYLEPVINQIALFFKKHLI